MASATTPPNTLAGIDDVTTGRTSAAGWIRAAAREHAIAFAPGPIDTFTDAVSRLSDAPVQPDATEQTLLALARAGIVTDAQRFALHVAYLRQKD